MPDTPTRASLPRDDTAPGERASQLEVRRDNYRFVHDWPSGIATSSWLPSESDYGTSYTVSLSKTYASIGANFAVVAGRMVRSKGPPRPLQLVEELVTRFEPATVAREIFTAHEAHARSAIGSPKPATWKDFDYIFGTWERPDIADKVDDQATLGDAIAWQRVAGVNPTVLARCEALPDGFAVTDDHVRAALGGSESLQGLLAEGRAFLADYRLMEGVVCGETEGNQKYLAGPMALYAADRKGVLRSVAIQGGSDPSRFPVRTARDGWHWRMANLCVQVADANHHEGSAHLGRTHMVMEVVGVATKRELAPNHPLALLLEPHLETTFAINHSAKTSLIAAGGTVDKVFAPKIRAFGDFVQSRVSTYAIRDANPHADLSARGLLDTSILPVHPYRDDMLPVFRAIHDHVDRYVRLYYATSDDVAGDTELTGFVAALGDRDGGRLFEVPEVRTVEQLVELITSFVWIASAQHSAVNFPQFRFMGYMPNMAGALFAPPPDRDTPNTESAFYDLLPTTSVTNSGVSMVYLLSDVRHTRLGDYKLDAFSDPRVLPLRKRFSDDLRTIEAEIQQRDATRWLPYPYLKPSLILQSISI